MALSTPFRWRICVERVERSAHASLARRRLDSSAANASSRWLSDSDKESGEARNWSTLSVKICRAESGRSLLHI